MVIMASSVAFAELHVHLEGMISPEMLVELDPGLSLADAQAKYGFRDFQGFIEAFKFTVLRLRSVDDYRLVARRCFEELSRQGIIYAEVIHSAGINLWRGLDAKAIAQALVEEGERAPLRVRWIFDGVRQMGGEHVLSAARLTAEFAGGPVVGFGVGGDERVTSVEELRPAFVLAKQAGLHLVPHAGETSNAANVWGALELGAERIGHGIRAIEDEALVRELARRRIPLEISLSSNVVTGAVGSLREHPAKRLYEAGVPIVLNTDDPAFFGTNLQREYELAGSELGFTAAELEELRQAAFAYAFDAG